LLTIDLTLPLSVKQRFQLELLMHLASALNRDLFFPFEILIGSDYQTVSSITFTFSQYLPSPKPGPFCLFGETDMQSQPAFQKLITIIAGIHKNLMELVDMHGIRDSVVPKESELN
jgi:hypothetical protein